MNKKNVHHFIEEQNLEEKENLRKMTEEKLGFSLTQESVSKKNTRNTGKIYAICASAMCIVCLLIMLPFLLNNSLKDNSEVDNSKRYCIEAECTWIWSENNIKEYNEENDTNLLYIDLYDHAAEVITQIYVAKNDETDIVFFYEAVFLEDTYDEIELYITDNRTTVDILVGFEESCKKSDYIDDVLVRWMCADDSGKIVFEYKGYKYFIALEYAVEETYIKQLVENMIV